MNLQSVMHSSLHPGIQLNHLPGDAKYNLHQSRVAVLLATKYCESMSSNVTTYMTVTLELSADSQGPGLPYEKGCDCSKVLNFEKNP